MVLTIRLPMPCTHSPGLMPAFSAGLPGTVPRTSMPWRPYGTGTMPS